MIVERLLKVALLGSSWVMYLLILLSVVSFGAMFERYVYFRKHRDDIPKLRRALHEALAQNDLTAAEALLARSPSIEAKVLLPALGWVEGGAEVVGDVIASELERIRGELEKGMNMLGTLGNNAPFVGLFGTVIGVIEAFHQLGDAGKNGGAMGSVMAGIAEALVATGVGLFVAIPAVVGYNVAQKAIGDVESNVASLAKLLSAVVKFREKDSAKMPAPRSSRASDDGPIIEIREVEVDAIVGVEG